MKVHSQCGWRSISKCVSKSAQSWGMDRHVSETIVVGYKVISVRRASSSHTLWLINSACDACAFVRNIKKNKRATVTELSIKNYIQGFYCAKSLKIQSFVVQTH